MRNKLMLVTYCLQTTAGDSSVAALTASRSDMRVSQNLIYNIICNEYVYISEKPKISIHTTLLLLL